MNDDKRINKNIKIKNIRVPTDFGSQKCTSHPLNVDGGTVIESCIAEMGTHGTMFLKEHTLIMVLKGGIVFRHGEHMDIVHGNEMVFFKKSTLIYYEEHGIPETNVGFDLLIFSFTNDLLKEFIVQHHVTITATSNDYAIHTVSPMSDCFTAFAYSLKPFFNSAVTINPGLLKLKLMEILYNLSECDKGLFMQILQSRQPAKADVRQVMEQYYALPVTLPELASLAGRSLSSFKRDFHSIYNMPPAQWIRERRLERAKELLQSTTMTVSDVCFSLGFENLSHFSRIFKEHYGIAPSDVSKQQSRLD